MKKKRKKGRRRGRKKGRKEGKKRAREVEKGKGERCRRKERQGVAL